MVIVVVPRISLKFSCAKIHNKLIQLLFFVSSLLANERDMLSSGAQYYQISAAMTQKKFTTAITQSRGLLQSFKYISYYSKYFNNCIFNRPCDDVISMQQACQKNVKNQSWNCEGSRTCLWVQGPFRSSIIQFIHARLGFCSYNLFEAFASNWKAGNITQIWS